MPFDPHPLIGTWKSLTSELVESVSTALEAYRRDSPPSAPSLAKVRTTWRPVPDALDQIEETVVQLGEDILAVSSNIDLTADARARRIDTLGDVAMTALKTATSDIQARAKTMLGLARDAVYPQRPQPEDALQEARLSGLKTDLKMALDPLEGQAAIDRIKELLARALTNGDQLSAWLLASSDWPSDYLRARDIGPYLMTLAPEIDRTIEDATPDAEAAVALYRTLSHPRDGLPRLDTLFNICLAQVFDTVKTWRPSTTYPTPPSRAMSRPTATDPTLGRAQPPRTDSTMSTMTF